MKKTSFIFLGTAAIAFIVLSSFKIYTGSNPGNGASQSVTSVSKAQNFQNLKDAFAGETTASAKYAAFSKKAEDEGYHEIAMLFKAASKSEKIHATNHKAVLTEAGQAVPEVKPDFTVKSTKENLQNAIEGETYEVTTMYPKFMQEANTAGEQLSLVSLNYAYKTELKHKSFYEKALASLGNGSVKSLPKVYYVCPVCGNTYENEAPQRCGISMTPNDRFVKIVDLNS